MLDAKLIVVGGDAKAGEFRLNLPCTIGRGREATLTLPHPLVSRVHCELFERNGMLVVKDLESLNGTFVNNQKIIGERILHPTELLTLGNVTFRAFYGDPASEVQEIKQSTKKAPIKQVSRETQSSKNSSKETVYAEEAENKNSSDTDKDLSQIDPTENTPPQNTSHKSTTNSAASGAAHNSAPNVVIDDPELPAADQSVSISALEELEVEVQNAIELSFAGGIELDEAEKSNVDAFQIELGDEPAKDAADDSKLGSFIRKLPR